MTMINLYYHPYIWRIKPHLGKNGKKYLQDIDLKSKWVKDKIIKSKLPVILKKSRPIQWHDYFFTHNKKYVKNIIINNKYEINKYSWITWSKSFLRAQLYIGGSLYQSAIDALESKISGALIIEGHHATKDGGSGFCTFNHLAVVINKLLKEKRVKKIGIIDVDYHLGDGTIDFFSGKNNIRILDIYGGLHVSSKINANATNIETIESKSHKSYLPKLIKRINSFILSFKPDIIFFIAGVDIFEHDRYGGIKGMTLQNVFKRDKTILNILKKSNIPTCFTLGGGYVAYSKEGTIISDKIVKQKRKELSNLHLNTIKSAL